jgi:hypothetical protein
MKQGVSLPNTSKLDKDILVSNGFLVIENSKYKLTVKAKGIISKLDNYFIKAKKKTDIQLMGKDYLVVNLLG